MTIVDKFNEVANNYASSAGDIGDITMRSAASMAAAGNTLDETSMIVSIRSNAYCKTHLIAGNPLEPCTTIVEKSHYDGLKTQGLGVHAAKLLRAIA